MDADGTDFSTNMGEDPAVTGQGLNALAEFNAGFALGATFRMHGCNVQDVVFLDGPACLFAPPPTRSSIRPAPLAAFQVHLARGMR
jgi:hypothetical protein